MRKFIISVAVGGLIGTLIGVGFLFIAPKLPSIFAHAFFYPVTEIVSTRNLFENKPKVFENQYHITTVDQDIPQEGKVVYAHLGLMHIILFENGEQVGEYPIKSIGREGTAWQTPLGKFDMSYKRENHFSSIGSVWMPYSMHFFGNYFIHGWPYYPDGRPVAQGYSGGCIRLDTPDAQSIFEFVDKNTQLIVTSSDTEVEKVDTSVFTYVRTNQLPDIDADFVIADIKSGEVIASSNSRSPQPIGSFAKLMNALISLETLNQYQETIFDQDIVTVGDVLYPLLMQADTKAGELLQSHINAKQYVVNMNTRAESLGMSNTIYADATGQNPGSVSTLDDTVRLFTYFYEYKPFILNVLKKPEYIKQNMNIKNQFDFTNPAYNSGFMSADQTSMLTLFSHDFKKDNMPEAPIQKDMLILVHGSFDAPADTQKLIEWMNTEVIIK